ncbi:SCO4226 family nickel-binding protein [Streptomyces sioyaensis]|uniref:SCO4226 family nickel-binding protein n=1 Tax=Streptomyces sioyaensis TaxID=67364 RepID=A0A4Q1R5S5_9ACTN|nr:SCO4226 family nickel-binding protein [Streptomyces sioyaensis]MBM4794155.1 SCO4226 family nickel-binding protein [Streptomyces sioyaensis]RXS68563.1 SCO4226 family nickel-binding protein [Streptomyces sioyaensis]
MPKFMDIHRGMEGLTADQLKAAHQADLAIEAEEGVHFEHAWADPDSGDVFCLSDAPSAGAVQRIHERAGHKADEIHPVPLSL